VIEFSLSSTTILEMEEIPAGSFLMGSSPHEPFSRSNERPQHRVEVSQFYLGKYPVTQAQWSTVMDDLPRTGVKFRGAQMPVVNVYLEKALEFCARLSALTGEKFRLPSEAEWEYSCRAGTTSAFSFGDELTPDAANFKILPVGKPPAAEECHSGLTPVGSFPANAFGLYDMHGNVWEWCADVWHENYVGAPSDGRAWIESGDQGYCVQRGGSWDNWADRCRSAFRVGDIAHNDDHIVGLRVCLQPATE
jgi:formylglycine-generating enzyme required for sulfatase activity